MTVMEEPTLNASNTIFVWNIQAFPLNGIPVEELVYRVKSFLGVRNSNLIGLYILCSRTDPERLNYGSSDVGLVHVLDFDDNW